MGEVNHLLVGFLIDEENCLQQFGKRIGTYRGCNMLDTPESNATV
jgi:hypothetical protein